MTNYLDLTLPTARARTYTVNLVIFGVFNFGEFREEDKFANLRISQNYYYNSSRLLNIEIDNSRILDFVKITKITNSRKS